MKVSFKQNLVALLLLPLALAGVPGVFAQAEKVKERAKDLKKKVEGTAPKTNAPPARPAPPK